MNAKNEWNIQPRSTFCGDCKQAFADRQTCRTLLRFNTDGYQRLDLCEHCFRKQSAGDEIHSSWKSVYRTPPAPARAAPGENAETVLRGMLSENDPRDMPVIYVLSIMLERKRILVERAARVNPEGRTQYVYEHRKSGETFIVTDPGLQLDRIDELEAEVARRLSQT